ncbi:ribonuclease P protein component [Vandammella animalimorsus]|uniref:ribonuclease P protein component n=1 Tax=Vandammella animalimorsus TaxID=2029117 RepID=UPI001EED551F|nr:ribonuclease P protein component [Vandammella animalimorsus]
MKTRQQFQAMLAQAPIARTAHFCLHRLPVAALPGPLDGAAPVAAEAVPAGGGAWVGALIPKRWAKRAVTRNLIRRQVYAVALEHLRATTGEAAATDAALPASPGLAGFAWLVRLRAGFHAPAAPGRGKGKRATPRQPATAQPDAAAVMLRSAASPQLRQQVRGQLQLLFARAAAPGAAAGPVGPKPKAQP